MSMVPICSTIRPYHNDHGIYVPAESILLNHCFANCVMRRIIGRLTYCRGPSRLQIERADFENGRFADSEFLAGAGFEPGDFIGTPESLSVHRVIPLHAFLSVFVPGGFPL
jgi:hypothetical protein